MEETKNIKMKDPFWRCRDILYIQYSVEGKLLNFIFSPDIISDVFYDRFDPYDEDAKKEIENKVIKTLEDEGGKLKYHLIRKALEDKYVQEELTKGNSASFSIDDDHFYDHTDERGRRIHKDYRSKK